MATTAPGDMPSAALRAALAGGIAMAAALGIGRFVLTPILPHMIDDLGLTASQAGLIASSNFLGYLIGAVGAAHPGFAGDRRRWLLAGLGLSVATTVAMAMISSLAGLMALRLAGGIASAFVLVFASSIVLETLARERKSALSWLHFAGVGTGIAISAIVVALVVNLGGDWRAQWLWSAVAALAGFVAVLAIMPPDARHAPSAGATQDGATGSAKGLAPLIAAYGLFGFGYVITATFISTMIRLGTGAEWLETGAWLVVGLSAAPSVALWTLVAGRIGPMPAFALAALAEAFGVASSVLFDGAAAVLIAAALLGGTFMGLTALGIAGARAATPGNPTRSIALMTASFGAGQMIGPTVGGLLADLTGSFAAPSLLAAAALLIAAGLAWRYGPAGEARFNPRQTPP